MEKYGGVMFAKPYHNRAARARKFYTGDNGFYPNRVRPLPPLSRLLLYNFNVGFYFLLCPWKLEYNAATGMITINKCSKLHKTLLLPLHALTGLATPLLFLDYSVVKIPVPIQALDATVRMGTCIYNPLFKFEIWTGSDEIVSMLSRLIDFENSLIQRGVRTHWIFQHSRAIAVCLHGFMVFMNLFGNEAYYHRNAPSGFYLLHLFEVESLPYKIMYNVAACIIEYENQVTSFAAATLMFLSTILFVTSRSVTDYVQRVEATAEVMSLYKLSLGFSQNIKSSVGNTVHWHGLLLLIYCAEQMKDVLTSSWIFRLQLSYYMLWMTTYLFIAAQAHAQFQSLTNALAGIEDRMNIYARNVQHLRILQAKMLVEATTNQGGLGLKGRGLTVTYSFFGTVMGQILAFSIAIAQLQEVLAGG